MKTSLKHTISNLFMLCLAAVALWSCDKDEDRIIIKDGTKPTVSVSQTNLVLKDDDKDKDALTLTWTKSDFGFDAAVNYTVEIGKKDSDFANAKVINMGNAMTKTFKVGELNMIANEMGMAGFVPAEMEIRVKADVGEAYAPAYSSVTTIMVTPYLSEPGWPVLYLVGGAAENGWDNTKATPFFRSETDPFVYTLTSYLKAGEFKLLGELGKWAPQWGMGTKIDATTANIKARPTEAEPDPASFSGLIPSDGYYTITVNLRNNTIKVEPFGAGASAPIYNSIGVVGAFTDWGGKPDIALTKSAVNPHLWNGTITLTGDTELKFRANSDWGNNWGAGADVTNWYGKGGRDSSNLKVKAGTYKVQFNDLTAEYVLIKQ